jgi:HAD superfamily hydrolase (TIGR01490 family)
MGTAIFDVDGTILRGTTGLLALDTFRRAGYISYRHIFQALGYHVLHRAGLLDARETYRRAIAPFVGRPVTEVEVHTENVYREQVRPALYRRAVELATEHRRRGDQVVLLSASSRFLLERFADALPVDGVIAFEQKIENGYFIDDFEEPVPYGSNKRTLALQWLENHGQRPEDATAYADSISDLPLLEAVGSPKPTNPDVRLRRLADKRGWPILRFYRVVGRGFRP